MISQNDIISCSIKEMKAILLALALTPILSFAEKVPFTPEDGTYEKGKWKYVRVVLNEGTRSEVSVGKLIYDNKEILGKEHHRLSTELGEFLFSTYEKKYGHAGWRCIDPKKKYSKWTKAVINQNSQKLAYWTTVPES